MSVHVSGQLATFCGNIERWILILDIMQIFNPVLSSVSMSGGAADFKHSIAL